MRTPQPKGTLDRTGSNSAPTYWECPECGYLSADRRFGSGDRTCPKCHSTDSARRPFPPDRLRKLDERIRAYHADGESEIVVILVATFLETLLEDILARIMGAHGADVTIRETVLDTQRAVGQRIGRLFPALTGEQFEDAAGELGYRDFPHRWRQVREARNAFIHDTPFRGARESIDEKTARQAMDLLDQAYRLFVSINNRFVADGRVK